MVEWFTSVDYLVITLVSWVNCIGFLVSKIARTGSWKSYRRTFERCDSVAGYLINPFPLHQGRVVVIPSLDQFLFCYVCGYLHVNLRTSSSKSTGGPLLLITMDASGLLEHRRPSRGRRPGFKLVLRIGDHGYTSSAGAL